mgnify:CR=1 FL=1
MGKITAYKGFNKDWTCRDFQYEVGKTFEKEGNIEVCGNGFHACLHPLDVFTYYSPASSKFAVVEVSGDTDHDEAGDTKVASARIEIKAEIQLGEMIEAAVKSVFDAAKWIKKNTVSGPEEAASATGYRGAASATGPSGAASATGYSGAASATGDSGAASATGPSGAASATGYSGAASATGYRGAASATGPSGAASATGPSGAASATGFGGRAMAAEGCAIFLAERNVDDEITSVFAGIAGKDGVKPMTWYTLSGGNIVEVDE